MELTKTATELLKTRIGYRNDGLSAGTFTIAEILDFETKQLENEDIFETCQRLHGTKDILALVKDTFGQINDVYGMWFGRKEDIILNYAEDDVTEINYYRIPEKALLLSDLGDEGVLLAFEEHPDFLFLDTVIVEGTISLSTKHSLSV